MKLRSRRSIVSGIAGLIVSLSGGRWASAKPRLERDPVAKEFLVKMPDYHRASREEWGDDVRRTTDQIYAIISECLISAADHRLDIEQRICAIGIATQFNIRLTGRGLTELIDLVDERSHPPGIALGRYPVVTMLTMYGPSAEYEVLFALRKETESKRRELLCEVLHSVLGVDQAVMDLRKRIENEQMTSEEKDRLQLAIDEVERQANVTQKSLQ